MNTVNDYLTQLFTLSNMLLIDKISSSNVFLSLNLIQWMRLTQKVMEKIIQYLRSSGQDAMQTADFLLYLAGETGESGTSCPGH